MSWKKTSDFSCAMFSRANRVKCLDPGKRLWQVQNSFCEDIRVELVLEMERENVFKISSFWLWNTAYKSCGVLQFDFLSYQKYITYDQMSDWHNQLVLICQYYQLFWSDKMFISKLLYQRKMKVSMSFHHAFQHWTCPWILQYCFTLKLLCSQHTKIPHFF